MDEVSENQSAEHGGTPGSTSPDSASAESLGENRSRRAFLHGSARKLAYAAPLILLFHPKPACASGGSQLTQA
jgi:hypothetical protein